MGKKSSEEQPESAVEAAPDGAELARVEAEDLVRAAEEQAAGAAIAEPATEAIARLEREVAEWKDRALRGAADHENYRRRAVREREEAQVRGQTEVLKRMLDVVDDLARVSGLDPATTTGQAFHEGMLAIERKFLKSLELSGVERINPAGERFDPNSHEAVSVQPAPSAEGDQTVGAVYSHGYRFKGTLLRPARVAVLQWAPPAAGAPADAAS